MAVVIETTIGDITIDLLIAERPRACLNFLKLCKMKYYNYNLFHHVERNFIAQTGDPSGLGNGGECIWGVIEGPHKRFFEVESRPKIRHSTAGLISLVSMGKNMVSSQFFLTLSEDLTSLDDCHCVFGEVVEGHDILRTLNESIVDEKFRPYQDIRITHTVILEDPFDDPRGFSMPNRSPSPTPERLRNGRIGAEEDIDDTDGKTAEEIQELLASREADAQATILEIVGDLPSVDVAPPENVLFVCKLNPVTTDDDLEIIFSRFGKIIGCEVIRDKQSGDSLQYAFVEFSDKKSCELAYFKMDNVLIDDRRIHVDFSQSVAKVQWRGKGRGLIHKDDNHDMKLDFNNYREKQYRKRPPHRQEISHSSRQGSNKNDSPVRRNQSQTSTKRDRRDHSSDRHNYKRGDRQRSPFRDHRSRNWNNSYQQGNVRSSYKDRRSPPNRERERSRERERYRSPNRKPIHKEISNQSKDRRQQQLTEKPERADKSEHSEKKKTKKSKKKSKKSSKRSSSSDSSSSAEVVKKKKKSKKHKRKSSTTSSSSSD